MYFSVDDKGNEAIFYKKADDGSFEKCARLDREAGEDANELFVEIATKLGHMKFSKKKQMWTESITTSIKFTQVLL